MSPGNYHGRILELPSKDQLESLVLIEDHLLPILIPTHFTLSKGAFISFSVNLDGNLSLFKIEHNSQPFDISGDALRWRLPTQNPSRMQRLKTRHQIQRGIREWFDQEEFIETDTPIQVLAPSPEAQFQPVKTKSGYLITSPEFQMKRLLVGGFERIYQLSHCFRNEECGTQHNPEFTLLEWYRTQQPLQKLTEDIEQFVLHLKEKSSSITLVEIPKPPWQRISVSELFLTHLDIQLKGNESALVLKQNAMEKGHGKYLENLCNTDSLTEMLAYEQVFFRLWHAFENKLGLKKPVFVHDWPMPLASLAKPCPNRPYFADRVELYANGMELANGFGELTDSKEQRRRFEEDLCNRNALGLEGVPLDENFLTALEQGMPASSGMALGVDRLIMWLTGTKHIRDVLFFSQDEL